MMNYAPSLPKFGLSDRTDKTTGNWPPDAETPIFSINVKLIAEFNCTTTRWIGSIVALIVALFITCGRKCFYSKKEQAVTLKNLEILTQTLRKTAGPLRRESA